MDVRPGAASIETSPRIAELGPGTNRATPTRRESVVYLETAPQAAFEDRPRAHVAMNQLDEAFVPYVLAITVGTTVDFPNQDRTYHNVFSLSRAAPFDLGRYPRGESKSVRFDRPGVVRVFCEIHSRMSAFIMVFAHRFFAVTDEQGRYRIEGVPAGSYELSAWADGRVRETRPIHVPEGGTAEADFVLK
ncbi:MAG: carboxypeptidase regulatory-like domain-containing protein [Thermoplasmata archaeon]|nr:carboxypeptidase regulatory-like domain-containing protein [Thermoplasmata archaeon]